MFPLTNRHRLPDACRQEFERLTTSLTQYLTVGHAEDGTHRLGEWRPWSVDWRVNGTAASLGDGELIARYMQIGHTVWYVLRLVAGSTTTFGSGAWIFNPPVPAAHNVNVGTAFAIDSSEGDIYPGFVTIGRGDTGITLGDSSGVWSASTPMTWAADDGFTASGFYEV